MGADKFVIFNDENYNSYYQTFLFSPRLILFPL